MKPNQVAWCFKWYVEDKFTYLKDKYVYSEDFPSIGKTQNINFPWKLKNTINKKYLKSNFFEI